MPGLIGKKIGMTSVFGADGKNMPCTVIEAGPCVVTQIRTVEKDGYAAVQLAYDEKKEKQTSAALKGHFEKAGTTPKKKLVEFPADFSRHPGSMGASSWPSRVFPGMRMAGHMGNERVKVFNLKVVKVIPEHNLLVVKGSVPGAKGSYVIVEA